MIYLFGMEERVCYRCLLRDFDAQKYKDDIEKYIEIIKKEERADDKLYNERLKICTLCDKLTEGTCFKCGCYVEMRAASKTAHCPSKKW